MDNPTASDLFARGTAWIRLGRLCSSAPCTAFVASPYTAFAASVFMRLALLSKVEDAHEDAVWTAAWSGPEQLLTGDRMNSKRARKIHGMSVADLKLAAPAVVQGPSTKMLRYGRRARTDWSRCTRTRATHWGSSRWWLTRPGPMQRPARWTPSSVCGTSMTPARRRSSKRSRPRRGA